MLQYICKSFISKSPKSPLPRAAQFQGDPKRSKPQSGKFIEQGYHTDDEKILALHSYFEKYGLKVAGRTDYTIRSGPSSRPDEIRRWIADKEDLESFCIIDDDDFYMWEWLSQFFVITRVRTKDERGYPDWQRTLSDADVERAIAILNRDNKAVIEGQF